MGFSFSNDAPLQNQAAQTPCGAFRRALNAENAGHPGTIDLLLTDIVMPHRNGRSLANDLREQNPGLRVMYMSGYPGDTIQRYEGIPAGDSFLQKPFAVDALRGVLQSLLG